MDVEHMPPINLNATSFYCCVSNEIYQDIRLRLAKIVAIRKHLHLASQATLEFRMIKGSVKIERKFDMIVLGKVYE